MRIDWILGLTTLIVALTIHASQTGWPIATGAIVGGLAAVVLHLTDH